MLDPYLVVIKVYVRIQEVLIRRSLVLIDLLVVIS